VLEENKVISERLREMWNKGDVTVVDELHTANFINHDPSRPDVTDLESYKRFVNEVRASMPDYHVVAEDVIAEGDKVVTRWTGTGTNEGAYGTIPPTGKQANLAGVTIYRLEDGKVAEAWWVYDSLGMMQQLGIIPVMQTPAAT
jgi:steroid delta-isomerase-like uncharacterized protein